MRRVPRTITLSFACFSYHNFIVFASFVLLLVGAPEPEPESRLINLKWPNLNLNLNLPRKGWTWTWDPLSEPIFRLISMRKNSPFLLHFFEISLFFRPYRAKNVTKTIRLQFCAFLTRFSTSKPKKHYHIMVCRNFTEIPPRWSKIHQPLLFNHPKRSVFAKNGTLYLNMPTTVDFCFIFS